MKSSWARIPLISVLSCLIFAFACKDGDSVAVKSISGSLGDADSAPIDRSDDALAIIYAINVQDDNFNPLFNIGRFFDRWQEKPCRNEMGLQEDER